MVCYHIAITELFSFALSTVLGTGLLTSGYAYGIESAADDVVTNTRKILNTAASDEDYAVFLQVMAFARNVSRYFDSVGQAYTGNFTKSRVRLLRGCGVNSGANTAFLRGLLQSRGLRFDCQSLAAFTNQLIDCRQNGHLLSIRVNL